MYGELDECEHGEAPGSMYCSAMAGEIEQLMRVHRLARQRGGETLGFLVQSMLTRTD